MNTTIDRQGTVPSRATTSVTLTAGALSVPLSIYTAVDDLAINRSERLNGDPAIPVGRAYVRKDTGAIIEPENVTRMAEAVSGKAAGSWVVLDDEDLATVYGNAGEAVIVSFVPVAEAGRYTLDGIMQVRAKGDKRQSAQAANEQAFSLLLTGMRSRGVHALVRFVMRGGPRYGLLTADGDVLTILPAAAVRQARPLPMHEHEPHVLDIMGKFIDAIGVAAEPVIDDTPARVQALIDSKAERVGVKVGATPVVTSQGAAAASTDIMAAITASIDTAKAAKVPAKKAARAKAGAK